MYITMNNNRKNIFAGKALDLQFFASTSNTTESEGMNAEMKTFYENA